MTKRLEILESSLQKKIDKFDQKLENHFNTVKQANGQPLNDKRNGQATLNKWERQNSALTNQQNEIEKTKKAIEIEKSKIKHVECFNIHPAIKQKLDEGTLTQWRKYPNRFFVKGVDKARIVMKDGKLLNSYYSSIPTIEQKEIFKDIYMDLQGKINATTA